MASITLMQIRGIPLRVHFTLLFALPYFALVFTAQFAALAGLAGIEAGDIVLPPLAWGAIFATGLFISVALHEFGHALVALQAGRKVRGVMLMLLGGISQIDPIEGDEHREFRHEALIAACGPLVSLGVAAVFFSMSRMPALGADGRFGTLYLSQLNLMIALFNMLPAFPLDGGRVLRAVLGRWLGFERGTRVAVVVGQLFAVALIVLSLMGLNIILMLIAMFIFGAGAAEVQVLKARHALSGLTAGDVMHVVGHRLDAGITVNDALRSVDEGEQVPVVHGALLGSRGRMIGLVDSRTLRRVPKERRGHVPVGLAAVYDIPMVRRQQSASQAMDLLVSQNSVVAVVDEDGALEGLIDQNDIVKRMEKAA